MRGSPPPAEGVCTPENFFHVFDAKSRVSGQFGPENKLIEGQPNEYDVIYWNTSVSAFHLWPAIFAGALFWLQNICRNSIPPHSHTTTPLFDRYSLTAVCLFILVCLLVPSVL